MQNEITAEYLASQGFSKTIIKRFWEKVKQPEEPGSGCWIWTAAKSKSGYGNIGRGAVASGNESAHRLSWMIHFGPIPDDLCVLHSCDNPPCVRPDHLWIGTHKNNSEDCLSKGRNAMQTRPELAPRKLTPEQVMEIRQSYVPYRVTTLQFCEKYGVVRSAVRAALSGATHNHVAGRGLKRGFTGHKLNGCQVSQIKRMYAAGKFSQRRLGKKFGVSKTMIRWIVNGKWWRHVH